MTMTTCTLTGTPLLKLESFNFDLLIEEGEATAIVVDLAKVPESLRPKVLISQSGNEVTVRAPHGNEGVTSLVNRFFDCVDRVFQSTGKPGERPFVRVLAPRGVPAHISMNGCSTLWSRVGLGDMELKAYGATKLEVAGAANPRIHLTGSSDLTAAALTGDVKLVLRGACRLNGAGAMGSVDISATGACNVMLEGTVAGNCKVSATGACDIVLKGKISGKVETSSAGASKVRFMAADA